MAASFFDKGAAFVKAHPMALIAGGAGVAGAAWGFREGAEHPNDSGKWSTATQRAFGIGVPAAIGAGALYASRGLLARTAWGGWKGALGAYGRSWSAGLAERSIGGMLRRPAIAGTLGGVLGAAVANRFGYDPTTGAIAGVAAGVVGYPLARNLAHNIRSMPKALRTPALLLGSAAIAVGAHAVVAEPNYEGEGQATPDGPFETSYGYRERLAAMNADGSMVFGLHNMRH